MSKTILQKHKKSNIRFQNEDIILYEPTDIQVEELKQLIKDIIQFDKDFNIIGEIDFKGIRFIIRELTSIGAEIDDMTDEEVQKAFDEGDRILQKLIKEISKLINEIAEDVMEEYTTELKFVNDYINVLNNTKDTEKIKEKVNKLFKKNKINLTFDDLIKINSSDENTIKEILNKVNK